MSVLIRPAFPGSRDGRYLVTIQGEPAVICETFEAALAFVCVPGLKVEVLP